tara:strand:+ start:224 stop:652 length:429 start_codon:yes stop_codon:yes gene_type:complete
VQTLTPSFLMHGIASLFIKLTNILPFVSRTSHTSIIVYKADSDLGSEATKSLFLNKDTKEKNSDASQKHESTSKTIIVRKKRKLNEELRQGEKGSDVLCKNAKESNEKDDSNPKSKSGKNTIEKSVISDMLGSYGSSSDDED